MSTYCAPCLADLALVREAVTSVSGTATCVAHAVLLTHPGDTPQQRLTRLSDLRAMAEEKLPNASDEDRPRIELLVQEYALAGAMDMTVPLRDLAGDRTPRPPKSRRNRGRDRDRREQRDAGAAPAEVSASEDISATPDADSSQESAAPAGAPATSDADRSQESVAPAGAPATSDADRSQESVAPVELAAPEVAPAPPAADSAQESSPVVPSDSPGGA